MTVDPGRLLGRPRGRPRAVVEGTVVIPVLLLLAASARAPDTLGFLAPAAGGLVAGVRSPGTVEGRVGAGMAAWCVFVIALLHLGVLFVLLGEGHGWSDWIWVALVLGPIGLLCSGFGAFLGVVAVALLPERVGVAVAAGPAAPPTIGEVPLLGLGKATVAGGAGTAAVTLAGLFSGQVLALFGAPIGGGLVAGAFAPQGRGFALLAGLCAGVLWAVGLLVLFYGWLASADGVGVGIGFTFLFVLVWGVLSIPLSGLGALLASLE